MVGFERGVRGYALGIDKKHKMLQEECVSFTSDKVDLNKLFYTFN